MAARIIRHSAITTIAKKGGAAFWLFLTVPVAGAGGEGALSAGEGDTAMIDARLQVMNLLDSLDRFGFRTASGIPRRHIKRELGLSQKY
jgi:hypothetical protein